MKRIKTMKLLTSSKREIRLLERPFLAQFLDVFHPQPGDANKAFLGLFLPELDLSKNKRVRRQNKFEQILINLRPTSGKSFGPHVSKTCKPSLVLTALV